MSTSWCSRRYPGAPREATYSTSTGPSSSGQEWPRHRPARRGGPADLALPAPPSTVMHPRGQQREVTMTNESEFSRRKFLGAAAGVAGVAAIGSAIPGALSSATAAAGAAGTGERLVPPGKLGIQHFSV